MSQLMEDREREIQRVALGNAAPPTINSPRTATEAQTMIRIVELSKSAIDDFLSARERSQKNGNLSAAGKLDAIETARRKATGTMRPFRAQLTTIETTIDRLLDNVVKESGLESPATPCEAAREIEARQHFRAIDEKNLRAHTIEQAFSFALAARDISTARAICCEPVAFFNAPIVSAEMRETYRRAWGNTHGPKTSAELARSLAADLKATRAFFDSQWKVVADPIKDIAIGDVTFDDNGNEL